MAPCPRLACTISICIHRDGSARACGVGDCPRLVPTLSGLEHLRTTNRQDSTNAPAMAASSILRHQEINFFDPHFLSHLTFWTSTNLTAPLSHCMSFPAGLLVPLHPLARCLAAVRAGIYWRPRGSELLRRRSVNWRRSATAHTPSTLPQRCGSPHTPKPVCCLSDQQESTVSRRAQIEIRIILIIQQRQ